QLFNKLAEKISKDENPESKVARLIREYEVGEENTKSLIREISEVCLAGFKETLGRAGISFDSW
ncbi:MAG: arginine--tRNA ligase, partial [Gammaproteobacteria bacterium]|nr:arginine--tRNA ligase [Gammaproteobacteria bacterium]